MMKNFVVFSCLVASAFSTCFVPKGNFDCRRLFGTFPDPRDCGKSFVQCPNPQGGETGAAISCGPNSWFDPVVCNCQPGKADCSKIRGTGQQTQTQVRPQRPQIQRPQNNNNNGGNRGRCAFTGCRGVTDSRTVFPDPNNSFGFIQCANGRPVRQQC